MGGGILDVELHAINYYTFNLVVSFDDTNVGKIDVVCGGGDGEDVQEQLQKLSVRYCTYALHKFGNIFS